MAYYSSTYAGSDFGEYNWNSYYADNYNYAQNQAFMAYNDHEFNQVGYGYDPSLYYTPSFPALNYPSVAYSATTFSDPKLIEYDPSLNMTQPVISYSTLEFNEPEFDDYDPTPYGGGYDIAQTYGKPLPHSEEICYPRSGYGANTLPSNALPVGIIVPMPNLGDGIDEKAIKPQNGNTHQVTEEMPPTQISSGDQPKEVDDNRHDTEDLKLYEGEDSRENHLDDDYYSGSNYGSELGNGYSGGHGDVYERQAPPQFPHGYGLETLDLCESLFGYWPCLSRMKKRGNCCEQFTDEGRICRENMWQGTADYLFGSPYPYGGRGEDGSGYGGETVYAYERQYPTQAQYRQVEYSEDLW